MFVLEENPIFKHDVKVKLPKDGELVDVTLTVHFKFVPEKDFLEKVTMGKIDKELCDLIVEDIEGVQTSKGKKVGKEKILALPMVSPAIAKAYIGALGDSILKN